MSKRKSFIIHHDSLDVIDKLTDEQAGKLLKAIKAHQLGDEYELDLTTELVFTPFRAQFNRDDKKYQKIVERNKNNGLKGGRPKNPTKPKEPSGLNGNPIEPKKADSDSDSDSKSDNKDIDRITDAFENIFWIGYHKKQGRAQAMKAFKSAIKREGINDPSEFALKLSEDCKKRISQNQFGFDNLNASTYLNNNRWEDEISVTDSSGDGGIDFVNDFGLYGWNK